MKLIFALLLAVPVWAGDPVIMGSDGKYYVSDEVYQKLWHEMYQWEYNQEWDWQYGTGYKDHPEVFYTRAYKDEYGKTWKKLTEDERGAYYNKFYPSINWDKITAQCKADHEAQNQAVADWNAQQAKDIAEAGGPGPR